MAEAFSSRSPLALRRRQERFLRLHVEELEARDVPSAAFDLTSLTAMRQNSSFSDVDGRLPGQPRSIGVAVLDTGAFGNHPDLRNNLKAYYDAVGNSTINGTVITNPASLGPAADPNGHGSHTAGTATSSNPNIGVATGADLIVVRALVGPNDRNVRHDTVLNALNWVVANQQRYNIRVVNMSLGSGGNYNSPIADSVGYGRVMRQLESLGVTIVAASGNSYGQFSGQAGAAYPAAAATVSVASVWEDNGSGDRFPIYGGGAQQGQPDQFVAADLNGQTGRLAASSQRSTLSNQVAAPGQTILSTWNGATDRNGQAKLYEVTYGTSMASPFVAGVVALMQDAAFTTSGRYLSPAQVVSILRSTADVFTDSNSTGNSRVARNGGASSNLAETGQQFRRVNVLRAVQSARTTVGGNPGGGTGGADANSTRSQAYQLPSINGTRVYSVQGRIGTDGSTTIGANDVDLVKVDVPYRGRLSISTSQPSGGTAFDSYLRVFDANGTQIGANDDISGSNRYSALGGIVNAGTYYIGVSSYNNANYSIVSATGRVNGGSQGDFLLQVQLTNPNSSSSANPYFDPNGTLEGSVDYPTGNGIVPFFDDSFTMFDDAGRPDISGKAGYLLAGIIGSDPPPVDDETQTRPDVGPGDVDMFRYVVPDNGRLFVRATSSDTASLYYTPPSGQNPFDTFLRVFDEDGNQIAFDDDGGTGTDSQLVMTNLTRGQVLYFAVSTYDNRTYDANDPNSREATGSGGYYELWSTFDNGDLNGTAYSAVQLPAIGTPAGGTIGADGRLDVDFLQVDVPSGADQVLRVTASGQNGFQPSVTIWGFQFDSSGNVTGFDRIASSNRNQAVVLAPVVGGRTYYVSFTGQGNGGFNWYATASGTGGETGSFSVTSELLPASAANAIQDKGVTGGGAAPRHLALGSTLDGAIGEDEDASGNTYVVSTFSSGSYQYGQGDLDTYEFTSPITGRVQFRAAGTTYLGTSVDPVLRVFNAAGGELAYSDDESDSSRDAFVTLDVVAGTTPYVGITGYGQGSADYQILNGAFSAAITDTTVGGYRLTVTSVNAELGPVRPVAVGGATDGSVRLVTDSSVSSISPFGNTGVPTRTASADVDGDAVADYIAITGPGTPLRLTVINGATGTTLVPAFDPFGGNFLGGGYVAAADLNGDGRAEFVATPDQGGGPRVTIFSFVSSTLSVRANFFGIDDSNFRGGARAAVGDVNRDGVPDVIVAAGFGGGPRTAVFTGQSVLSGNPTRLINDFFAFPGSDAVNLLNGAFVAVGDLNGDGFADLVFGGGPGGAPRVFALSGQTIVNSGVGAAQAAPLANFFVAGDSSDRGGARVAITNSDGDNQADLAVGSGSGRPSRVRVYLGTNFTGGGEPGGAIELDPFGGIVLIDGVFVG